jgi:hypothetical protein
MKLIVLESKIYAREELEDPLDQSVNAVCLNDREVGVSTQC